MNWQKKEYACFYSDPQVDGYGFEDGVTYLVFSDITELAISSNLEKRIQANCEKEIVLEGVKGKTVLVKIVGEGADFIFNVERSY